MSKNLQKMMAAKYPTSPSMVMKESVQNTASENEESGCFISSKKILLIIFLMSVLFFILCLPYTFKLVGTIFPRINSVSTVDTKLVLLHSIVFAIGSFFIFRGVC